MPDQAQLLVESAGAEIDCDRAHHSNGVKAGQTLEFLGHGEDQDRNRDRNEERNPGNAVAVQARELPRHFPILRHHVNDADERDDRGVDGAEEEQTKDHANHETEDLPGSRTNHERAVVFREEAQHVFLVRLKGGREGGRE